MSEKIDVAFKSVLAAVFLTIIKMVVGLTTRSLGIISEAAHSALDLGAAFITLFAVKASDKPADERHNFGHGKIENFSALIEAFLLLVTCIWIIYEAVGKIASKNYDVKPDVYAFAVMIITIVINISRFISLDRAAKKFNSQALKADALHFSSDIYSSIVVLVGLFFSSIGFPEADPIAALGVSVLVLIATFRLSKETYDALIDTAPIGSVEKIKDCVMSVDGVLSCEKVRVRTSGSIIFIDINVGLNEYENHQDIHRIIHEIREKVNLKYPNSDISIYTFPVEESDNMSHDEVYSNIKKICYEIKGIKNAHHIKVFNVEGKKHILMHVEAENDIDLEEAHRLVHVLKEKIIETIENVSDVFITPQIRQHDQAEVVDVTVDNTKMLTNIELLVNNTINNISCHKIKLYKQDESYTVFLHCNLSSKTKLDGLENVSSKISKNIKKHFSSINDVNIHFEPEK